MEDILEKQRASRNGKRKLNVKHRRNQVWT
jgi:hypothetical protein